jgi:FkbH-like protein
MREPGSCVVLADFNPANLAACLRASGEVPQLSVRGQMMTGLAGALEGSRDEIESADVAVVWTEPGRISAEFAAGLAGGVPDSTRAIDEVDEFARQIETLASRIPTVLVASWALRPSHRGFGMAALEHATGMSALLLRMNLRLIEQLASLRNVHVLDSSRWMIAGGPQAFNPRLWFMAKIPFSTPVFQAAAQDLKAALRGIAGEARRLIVLDLDNTLWGGLVGEAGWEALRLGGHDPAGEAFVDFQHTLKALSRRGTLLAIVSKNDEAPAMEALQRHPEMVLRPQDFAAIRINWRDKAANVLDILTTLNLGAGSAVFIDDHPVERARVHEALPDVLVPDWPENPLLYASALSALNCFDAPGLTGEDRARTSLYRAEHERAQDRPRVGSTDEWLDSLELCVRIGELSSASSPRVAQLLNKTNQMNLSTRRLSEAAFVEWGAQSNRRVWTFRLSDRFGDAGLIGLLSLQMDDQEARVVDFVVSCRVIGRRVEETMLHHAIDFARSAGATRVLAQFQPTERNGPCRQFLERSGLSNGDGGTFWWDASRPYPRPSHVRIEHEVYA